MKKIQFDPKYITQCKYIIDLMISTNCNFRCSYCDTRHEYPNYKPIKLEHSFKFIDDISVLNNVNLSLVGGEPTLYKELNSIIDYSEDKVQELELYTNGSVNLEKFHLNNLKTIISIHPHFYKRYRGQILRNIQYLESCGFNFQIRLMLEPQDLTLIMNDLNKYDVINFRIFDPYTNQFLLTNYTENNKVIFVGDDLISIDDYIKKYYKPKKPYLCLMNSFLVLPNGNVEKYCTTEDKVIGNLFDKNVFKDLKVSLKECKQTKGCIEIEMTKYARI